MLGYLCSNSYGVLHFLNPIIIDIFQNMTDLDSSAGEDHARFPFVSWCTRCGHQFRTKQHARKHLARCPPPHELRCGCCGANYSWTDFVQHVNVRGVCRRRQRCYLPPLPSEPRYNISCCSLSPSLPLSRPDALPLAASAAVAASSFPYASISIGGAHQGLGGAKPPQIFHEICGCVLKKVSQQSLKR